MVFAACRGLRPVRVVLFPCAVEPKRQADRVGLFTIVGTALCRVEPVVPISRALLLDGRDPGSLSHASRRGPDDAVSRPSL